MHNTKNSFLKMLKIYLQLKNTLKKNSEHKINHCFKNGN